MNYKRHTNGLPSNPHDYNQFIMDYFAYAHGNCMDCVLDPDQYAYEGHNIVRDIIGKELFQASVESQRFHDEMHKAVIPAIEMFKYKRTVRNSQ